MEILLFLILAPLLLPLFFIVRFVIDPILNFTIDSRDPVGSALRSRHPSIYDRKKSESSGGGSWFDRFTAKPGPSSAERAKPAGKAASGNSSRSDSAAGREQQQQMIQMEHEQQRLQQEIARLEQEQLQSMHAQREVVRLEHIERELTEELSQARRGQGELTDELAQVKRAASSASVAGGTSAPTAQVLDKATLLESDVVEKREEIINEINNQINPSALGVGNAGSDSSGNSRVRSDAGIILRKVDTQLRDELDKIGKVFVGLSNRQLSFSEEELKTFLTSTYFRVMGSAVAKRKD
ncbi:MAG: hypothetical protein HN353_07550 [Bdellovibrionales bacterium]|jgi:hypothetical protein|nr:hypothetical protein [Bdellovibrionales bacterium]MBT3526665.1 hypothetical protein [Bdellovibrionales bacterium]MBT7669316.1 hypothetical protein [Bdellovibrionales bacterium]MBT7767997.1 hypothetical protein [Bdellovibrionales bacterium]